MALGLISSRSVSIHAQKLAQGNVEHYFLRAFANPAGPIEPTTGQPWKPYFATGLLSVEDNIGLIGGTLALPKNCLPLMRDLGERLELSHFIWERWDFVNQVILPPMKLRVK